MKWMRLWVDILDDPKLAVTVTPAETFRVMVLLMAYARELDNAGKIDQVEDVIAWRLRLNCSELRKHLLHLRDLKIITLKPEIKFINWDKRQFLSDDSSERVKRYRIRKCNVTTPLHETPPEQIQSRADTEQSKDKREIAPTAPSSLAWSLPDLWSERTKGKLPGIAGMSKARERQIKNRMNDTPHGLDRWQYWKDVIDRIVASDFCRGENDRGWTASFDWLIRPETHLKVMEGKYDNRQKVSSRPADKFDQNMAAIKRSLQKAEGSDGNGGSENGGEKPGAFLGCLPGAPDNGRVRSDLPGNAGGHTGRGDRQGNQGVPEDVPVFSDDSGDQGES